MRENRQGDCSAQLRIGLAVFLQADQRTPEQAQRRALPFFPICLGFCVPLFSLRAALYNELRQGQAIGQIKKFQVRHSGGNCPGTPLFSAR